MKLKYTFFALLSSLTLVFTACDYNDQFDGLTEGYKAVDVKNVSYTLTADDYKTIAGLAANKALAKNLGDSAALSRLSSTRPFTASLSALNYLPAFIYQKWITADDRSVARITYNVAVTTTTPAGTTVTTTETRTSPFLRVNGKWVFNPSREIDLLPLRGDATSTLYYTEAVNYVRDSIDSKLATSAAFVNQTYKNEESYSGCSWYYNNVSLSSVVAKDAATFGGKTEAQQVKLLEPRLVQTLGYAVNKIHADVEPVADVDVIYTLRFALYTGTALTTPNYQIAFKCVSKGKFEYVPASLRKI